VDEQNLPKTISGVVGRAAAKQRTLPGMDSSVVFFGDPVLVQEGFAIALRAMGVDQSEPGEDPDA
jgi:hypothetical protein